MANLPDLFRSTPTFRDLGRLQRQMENQMGRLFGDLNDPFYSMELSPLSGPAFTPSCDIEETENEYLMSFDLPGVKEEDMKIELKNHILTVSGERKEEKRGTGKSRGQTERFYGAFARSFTLPEEVKAEDVEAHYENGVLKVTLPKSEEARATEIKIGQKRENQKRIDLKKKRSDEEAA